MNHWMKGENIMSFWDTVLGHRLADTLNRNLPKIAEAMNILAKTEKKTQKVEIVYKYNVVEYLNAEFGDGRKFVNMTEFDTDQNGAARFLIITE
jgi:hypothetical protein